ncbi:MAG: nucleotide excision repair endonuclease, partial [bacterium]
MKIKDHKKINIPDKPGVYFFMKGKTILYIGKATSLRDRTRSYFPSTTLGTGRLLDSRGPMILDMVVQADNIKWQETDSVLEALILESSLIKKHLPKYNVKEKDD